MATFRLFHAKRRYKMKIGVMTGGGDTQALNATLYGILKRAKRKKHEVIGFKRGWQGVLDLDYTTLNEVDPNWGGTILKTSRKKLMGEEINQAANNIARVVDSFIAIGGDDTLTVGKEISDKLTIPFCFITKTIDNDVGLNMPEDEIDFSKMINYFTPGFPTAASRIASYTGHLRTTAYSHDRIIFLEAMGRKPGWLALASYKGNPDFILIPEVGLDYNHFLEKLLQRYREKGNVVVVVAEGIRYKGHKNPISEDPTTVDDFGHKKLGGVAEILAKKIRKDAGIENCKFNNPGYLYRSGRPKGYDLKYAQKLGKVAVDSILKGQHCRVAVLQRKKEKLYTSTRDIENVLLTDENNIVIPRVVDSRFYDAKNYMISNLGKEYFRVIK
jgi:ATP-dependent phosphofructokinase / diphosphate-dependent phosphofructokinase